MKNKDQILLENLYLKIIKEQDENESFKSINEITDNILDEMVAAAQAVYDQWQQDEEGNSIGWVGNYELGQGGICHIIADDMIDVLYKHGIRDVQSVCSSFEQHVYIIGQFKEGIYEIDIPYRIYETGGGFTWKKIPDVEFVRSNIRINGIDDDPKNISQYTEEY
jgi:hypothetical protein